MASPNLFFLCGGMKNGKGNNLRYGSVSLNDVSLLPPTFCASADCSTPGRVSVSHILRACYVTFITVTAVIVTLPLLPSIVFPMKRRNRHSLVGPQQAGGRPAPVRRSNTMPPNLGNAGLLGRMLDEKAPPSPSGMLLFRGSLGQPVGLL